MSGRVPDLLAGLASGMHPTELFCALAKLYGEAPEYVNEGLRAWQQATNAWLDEVGRMSEAPTVTELHMVALSCDRLYGEVDRARSRYLRELYRWSLEGLGTLRPSPRGGEGGKYDAGVVGHAAESGSSDSAGTGLRSVGRHFSGFESPASSTGPQEPGSERGSPHGQPCRLRPAAVASSRLTAWR